MDLIFTIKKYLFYILLIIISKTVICQQQIGYFSQQNFPLNKYFGEIHYSDLIVDNQGVLWIGSNKSIIRYDGQRHWEIAVPSSVSSLKYDSKNNILYVGCLHHIGQINLNSKSLNLDIIKNNTRFKLFDIKGIANTDNQTYFLNQDGLYVIDNKSPKNLKPILTSLSFDYIFSYQENIYICQYDYIFKLTGDTIETVLKLPKELQVTYSDKYEKQIIIGTNYNRLFYFNGKTIVEKPLNGIDQNNFTISKGIYAGFNRIAFSSESQGCILYDLKQSTIIQILENNTGLPDNEIEAIALDQENGIWLAHGIGLTRIDTKFPVKNINYPGLKGSINAISSFQNALYIGTSEGLFTLTPTSNASEVTIYRKKIVKKESQISSSENKKKKKRLFKKNNRLTLSPTTIIKDTFVQVTQKVSNNIKYESVLFPFYYKKIEDIGKVIQLHTAANNQLYILSTKGLFVISENKKVEQLSNASFDKMYFNNKEQTIYLLSENNKIISYELTTRKLSTLYTDTTGNYIESFYCNKRQLWLIYTSHLLFGNRKDENNKFTFKPELSFENPYLETFSPIIIDNHFHLLSSHLTYQYDMDKNELLLISKDNNKQAFIVQSQQDLLWKLSNGQLNLLPQNYMLLPGIEMLQIYNDINKIYLNKDKNQLVFSTGLGELQLVDLAAISVYRPIFDFDFHNIISMKGNTIENNYSLAYQDNGFKLSLYNSYYLSNNNIRYKYKITSQDTTWISCDESNNLEFSNLNPGKYVLQVKAIDPTGKETEAKTLTIHIDPPFWETWWFVLLEISFFGTLLTTSYQLNRRGTGNRFITNILTTLTIVLVVELFTEVIENYVSYVDSPIISFAEQVGIALLLVPFESLFHRVIKKEKK